MRKIFLWAIACCCSLQIWAQAPTTGRKQSDAQALNIGHLFGKIKDSKTGKNIGGASVLLVKKSKNAKTLQEQEKQIKISISEDNGDFSLENIPLFGDMIIRITAVGYKQYEKSVNFGLGIQPQGKSSDMSSLMEKAENDLGNIKLSPDAGNLGTVVVTANVRQQFTMGLDKKVFTVDKSLTSSGQTATDIMKNIPSVNVDIDGNVTIRNATPTLFVDGRPTTLTLDEIPSDMIDKIEVITNPSAKYDASGGEGGILNVILKKNDKSGYNGGITASIDSKKKPNGGANFSYKKGKWNFNLMGDLHGHKSTSTQKTDRLIYGSPDIWAKSNGDLKNNGTFYFLRAAADYAIDVRNTISANITKVHGDNDNNQPLLMDSIYAADNTIFSETNMLTTSHFNFNGGGGQLAFQHNFKKSGHTLTADIDYRHGNTSNTTTVDYHTYQPGTTTLLYPEKLQQDVGSGYNHIYLGQVDYENPISDVTKIESGFRANMEDIKTEDLVYVKSGSNPFSLSQLASSNYKYNDQTYAAYFTFSSKVGNLTYQVGLRGELYNYKGKILGLINGQDSVNFKLSYPVNLFPSFYLTYKIGDVQNLQLNYSRRVSRPTFFQMIPSYNFSDAQNPTVGNPNLKPQYTNSLEFSYSSDYKPNANFLATLYLKYTTDLITRYLYKDIDRNTTVADPTDSLFYTSYMNSSYSYSYGLELTDMTPVTSWWDVLLNANFYDSKIHSSDTSLAGNSMLSWFGKINNTFKIKPGWSFQLNAFYQSSAVVSQSTGESGGGGRGGMGTPTSSAQGYILPRYSVDAAIRKEWSMKKGQNASLTLSVNDVFKTLKHRAITSESGLFYQTTWRTRDPQMVRLTFAYRFGKMNFTKNKKSAGKDDQNDEMIGGND